MLNRRLRGDLTGADSLLSKSIDITRKLSSESEVEPMVEDLAVLRLEQRDEAGALVLARQVAASSYQPPVSDVELANRVAELARLLAKHGECDAARKLYGRVAAMYDTLSVGERTPARAGDALSACRIVK